MSTADVKIVQLHGERIRLSRTACDESPVPVDGRARGAEPEDDGQGRTGMEAGSADAAPAPAKAPVTPATPKKRTRKVRTRHRARTLSPAAVLARSVVRSEPPRAQELLQALERGLDRLSTSGETPVVPAPAEPASPEAGTDEDEFWLAWLEHRDYLHRYSIRFSGGNLADAEDALSEAMLKAARTFSPTKIRNHRAWLLRLVHNACMDRHRGNRRHTRAVQDIKSADSMSAPAVAVLPERSPEDLVVAFQQLESVKRALGSLPAFLFEPLMLHLDEHPDAEIADTLNVTREVIRKRRQIARALLRRQLSF